MASNIRTDVEGIEIQYVPLPELF